MSRGDRSVAIRAAFRTARRSEGMRLPDVWELQILGRRNLGISGAPEVRRCCPHAFLKRTGEM
jgi:hypothetical protein